MNEKATSRTQAWVGAAMILLNVALQISDYHSPPIAIFLAIVAVFFLVPWLKERKTAVASVGKRLLAEYGKSNLMTVAILIGAFVGALIGGSLAGIGWWMAKNPRNTTAEDSSTFFGLESHASLDTPPRKHINTFTPREIQDQLTQTGPLERNDVADGFVNGVVDWTLLYTSLQKLRGDNTLLVTFNTEPGMSPSVTCQAPLKGNEYLGRIKDPGTVYFRVKGVINEVEVNRIVLIEASFEQVPPPVPAPKPTPTPVRTSQVVPPRSGALPSSQGKTFTDKTPHELLAFFKGRTALQASEMIAPYMAKWIETEGKILNLYANNQGVLAVIRTHVEGDVISCPFDHRWREKLRDNNYEIGFTLKLRGKIADHQNGSQLYLEECELV
jgi:hypothetical protein